MPSGKLILPNLNDTIFKTENNREWKKKSPYFLIGTMFLFGNYFCLFYFSQHKNKTFAAFLPFCRNFLKLYVAEITSPNIR